MHQSTRSAHQSFQMVSRWGKGVTINDDNRLHESVCFSHVFRSTEFGYPVLPSHRVPFLPKVLDLCIPGKRQSGRSPLEQLHRISSMSYTYQQQTTELVKVENVKLPVDVCR